MSNFDLITSNLVERLKSSIEQSKEIYILSAFVMVSGAKLISPYLKKAIEKGAEVKICTGDYLYITQPNALQLLFEIDNRIEIRLFQSGGHPFHPKAFLMKESQNHLMIVGSSNLSNSALTTGIEWNLATKKISEIEFDEALDAFFELFYHDQTVGINNERIKEYEIKYTKFHENNADLVKIWIEKEKRKETELHIVYDPEEKPKELVDEAITPHFVQQDALHALNNAKQEGYNKSMVIMATGLGKTYLSAFFSLHFDQILFLAHREEILKQTEKSFLRTKDTLNTGFYYSKQKDIEKKVIFASVQTLALKHNLQKFDPHHFDLIIVDEFHHAAAKSYQKIMNHFQPSFLLGMTATPYRLDGKDIFSICDGNVAYQMHFIEAIELSYLTPFHYVGIYDDIDYTQIKMIGKRYDQEELLKVQLQETVVTKIFDTWMKHKQKITLAFCSSIIQANYLSNYFTEKGIKSLSLHSQTHEISREQAIKALETGQIDILFTIDLFNEGVDIPAVDTLLFVRPTQSITIFTQQIGRGPRKHKGKENCKIIDLIGNYRNVQIKFQLFDRTGFERQNPFQIPQVPVNL